MNLPEAYIKKMKRLLGSEFDAYIKSFSDKRHYGLRVNTLKISVDDFKNNVDWDLAAIPWCKEGFYYDGDNIKPAKHPYYSSGLFYIQEPSAMSSSAILPIEEGDRVIDLCAAPGGKTTQAAAKLKGSGLILSNDISASRCKPLVKNIELNGVKNAIVTSEEPSKLADKFEAFFTKVIVDAPCSGEGMFRKDENMLKSWSRDKLDVYCQLQRDILKSASKLLCDGGIIVYSTCTFAPEENEGIIQEFLNNNANFSLMDIDKSLGFEDGRPDWINSDNNEIKKCGRLMPYKIKGEGHFIALLIKNGTNEFKMPIKDKEASNKELKEYHNFASAYLNIDLSADLVLHKDSVFKVPYLLDLSSIRVVRSGLNLGTIKRNRFEPSQALAMALKMDEAKLSVNFSIDDERLLRYLKGESFNVECDDGWALVCVDSFPLGWGKVQNGRLKNKYAKSWIN